MLYFSPSIDRPCASLALSGFHCVARLTWNLKQSSCLTAHNAGTDLCQLVLLDRVLSSFYSFYIYYRFLELGNKVITLILIILFVLCRDLSKMSMKTPSQLFLKISKLLTDVNF